MKLTILTAALGLVLASPAPGQDAGPKQAVQEAQKLLASDVAAAITTLERALAAAPQNYELRLTLGRALDLDGRHPEARTHLEQALTLASPTQRNAALTALAVSYAFEAKADEAARYYQRVFDADRQADDRAAAAARANALGRIYLESGNLQKAEQWYTTGYQTAREIPGVPAPQAALWEMRHQNALGRIAARRGDRARALEHAAAVKGLLPKLEDDQRVFYPYLMGYIAFFAKDYRGAIDELQQGDQSDPFVLGLIAQSYERLGDRAMAGEYYRKVLAVPSHSINAAFSRPAARAFLR